MKALNMQVKDSVLVQNREIRVFISSTFHDMQGERDYLMRKVFPVLKGLAAERNVTLVPVDLRWGITEQESKNGKVIEVCLREIENTFPFFIGIVGDRYGWCPRKEDVRNLKEKYDWLEKDIESGLSITEIEMQYGVLRNPANLNAFFFLKGGKTAPAVTEEEKKLERFKQAIRSNEKYPVMNYCSIEDLGTLVEKTFLGLLDRLFPAGTYSEEKRQNLEHTVVLNNLCQFYIPEEEGMAALDSFMDSDDKALIIDGPAGCGKSALVANWLKQRFGTEGDFLYHSIGSCREGFYAKDIIKRITGYLSDSERDGTRKPLVIVDGNWFGMSSTEYGELMTFLFRREPLPKLILTHPEWDYFSEEGRVFHMQMHSSASYWRKFVEMYLQKHCKRLTSFQIDRIVSNILMRDAVILKTFLDEIISFGVYERLDEYIDYFLASTSKDDFYQRILEVMEKEHGEECIRTLMSCLLLAGEGLQEDAMMRITGITALKWSQIFSGLQGLVVRPSGYIKFNNYHLQNAVVNRYNPDNTYRRKIIEALKGECSLYAFGETGFQYCVLERYEEFRDQVIGRYADYRIDEESYLNYLTRMLEMIISKMEQGNVMTVLEILRHFLECYFKYYGQNPSACRGLYETLTLIGYFYSVWKDLGVEDDSFKKDVISLARAAKEFMAELYEAHKDVKAISRDYQYVMDDICNVFADTATEEELWSNLDLLKRIGCNSDECVNALMVILNSRGEYQRAAQLCEKYCDLKSTAKAYHASATSYAGIQELGMAENQFLKCVELYGKLAEENPAEKINVALEHKNLARVYLKMGEKGKALSHYQTAQNLYSTISYSKPKALLQEVNIRYIIAHGCPLDNPAKENLVQWCLEEAERGEAEMQRQYGRMLEIGLIVEKDEKKAVEWYRKSADAGDMLAQRALGEILSKHEELCQEPKEQIKWYSKAVEQGDAVSQYDLASAYYNGDIIDADYKEAFKLYLRLAQGGDINSQFMVATMYRDGNGVDMDFEKAFEWFGKAAKQGNYEASFEQAMMYISGKGVEQNYKQAHKILTGLCRTNKKRVPTGAYLLLGIMYTRGMGCEANDNIAFWNFKEGARNGEQSCIQMLAKAYYYGKGCEIDYCEAAKWFEKSAEAGNVNAQKQLAHMYSIGRGVPKDLSVALDWNWKALEQTVREYGPDDERSLSCINSQSWFLYLDGQYEEALPLAQSVISRMTDEMSPVHKANCLDTLASIYAAMGQKPEAVEAYGKCIEQLKAAPKPNLQKIQDLEYKIQQLS